MKALKRYTCLEDCYLVVAVFLVVNEFARCYFDDIISESARHLLHVFTFSNHSGIEINPSGFIGSQLGVGSYLHGRYIRTKGRTSTGSEEHDMASARSERGRSYEVITWC